MAGCEQADFLVLARSGHYLPVEQPGRFAAAVAAWLAAGRLFLDPDERPAAPPIVPAQ